ILYFFFFQAEDGIRDKLVTGVQTCALPISEPAMSWRHNATSCRASSVKTSPMYQLGSRNSIVWRRPRGSARRNVARRSTLTGQRSEERRVGKECRSGWGRGE